MKRVLMLLLFVMSVNICAQQEIQFIKNVPESFKTKYFESKHEYNPLHVGDIWQYTSQNYQTNWFVVKDTLVGVEEYFKKVTNFATTFERNDRTLLSSYLLDVDDLDQDGNTNEELLLDSLDVPYFTDYISYRLINKYNLPDIPSIAQVEDSSWAVIFGDTVMTRRVQFLAAFTTQVIADKFGVVWSMTEGPAMIINGAIINGNKYGVIVAVEDEDNSAIPKGFRLSQNYPNPFNPTTQIKYQLPKEGYVTLKVYDILGRDVATLVNQKQSIGRYEKTFSASGGAAQLAAGVYIYRLTVKSGLSGSFTSSKKMLLLK